MDVPKKSLLDRCGLFIFPSTGIETIDVTRPVAIMHVGVGAVQLGFPHVRNGDENRYASNG